MRSASRVVWYEDWRRDKLEELLLKGKNGATASLWRRLAAASRTSYKTTRDRVSLVSVGGLSTVVNGHCCISEC